MIVKEKQSKVNISQHVNAYKIQIPVSINKVLLEHHHAHSFMYHLWLLLCYNSGIMYNKGYKAHEALNIYYLAPFYYLTIDRKSLLTSV